MGKVERTNRVLVAIFAFVIAPLFTSCDGAHAANKLVSKTKNTVIVMRHCVRSTGEDGISDVEGFNKFIDYSKTPWPEWTVPAMECLHRGEEIVRGSGRWLLEHQDLPRPIRVVADAVKRDNTTARALMAGLGLQVDDTTFASSSSPFSASTATQCAQLTPEQITSATMAQVHRYPMPPYFQAMFRRMLAVTGKGAAGDWTAVPCHIDSTAATAKSWQPSLVGVCQAASELAERFLMEWGGNYSMGWGKMSASDVAQFLGVHAWFRKMTDGVPSINANQQASIFRNVLSLLETNDPGTSFFVGHDSQLNALNSGLGLTWDASPFPVNATLPGSALRFDRVGDVVTAQYIYVTSFSDNTGGMTSVPASFGGIGGANSASLSDFKNLVDACSVAACANPLPPLFNAFSDDAAEVLV